MLNVNFYFLLFIYKINFFLLDFGKTFLGHHNYITSLSNLYVEIKEILREIMHFLTIMVTP